jgi:ribosomal protein L32
MLGGKNEEKMMKVKNLYILLILIILVGCNSQPIPSQIPTVKLTQTPIVELTTAPCSVETAVEVDPSTLQGRFEVTPIIGDDSDDIFVYEFLFENEEYCLKSNIFPFRYWDWQYGEYPREYSLNQLSEWNYLEKRFQIDGIVEGQLQTVSGSLEEVYILHKEGWLDEGLVSTVADEFNLISHTVFSDLQLDKSVGSYYLTNKLCKYDFVETDYTLFCPKTFIWEDKYLSPQGIDWIEDWFWGFQPEVLAELSCGSTLNLDGNDFEIIGITSFRGTHDTGYKSPVYIEFLSNGKSKWVIIPEGTVLSQGIIGVGFAVPYESCGNPQPPQRICQYCG